MSEYKDIQEEAVAVVKQLIERGKGAEGSSQIYSDAGAKYEQYMDVLNYHGPSKTAEVVSDLFKNNFDIKVLDIGAGTGLVGEELVKLGYKNLDAVDAAEGLLKVAEEKQIYNQIVCQFVGSKPLPFEIDSYDLAVSCGAMQENHIPREAFRDIIRVVKSGGYVVTVFRAEAEKAAWYKEGLDNYMSELEAEGLWKLQSKTTFSHFIADKDGLIFVHRVA